MNLDQADPQIAELIKQESRRQETTLELIASENFTHPAVMEAAVIAEADETGGTIASAYVLLRPGHSPGELLEKQIKEEAAKSLPRYKRPQRIHFMTELPRTPTGKVQRFKLRQLSRGA